MAQDEIVNQIQKDHKFIKEQLQRAMNEALSFKDKMSLYKELAVQIMAHAKAEEAVLYVKLAQNDENKKYAYLGFEDHGLIELLIEEMKFERNPEKWNAKFETLCKLIDRHIDEEESEYLPKLKQTFTKKECQQMGDEYKEMFNRFLKSQRNFESQTTDITTH